MLSVAMTPRLLLLLFNGIVGVVKRDGVISALLAVRKL